MNLARRRRAAPRARLPAPIASLQVIVAVIVAVLGNTACDAAPPPLIRPCAILEASCQKQLFLATDRLRGQVWDLWSEAPAVEVVSEVEYRFRSEARARALQRAASSSLWSGALHGLGVLAPELDIATADHLWFVDTLASYDPAAKRVTIVDRGLALADVTSTTTLVHEYVHALQDRDLGLDWAPILTTDQEMVRTAMIEGEAVLFDRLGELQMESQKPADFDWRGHFADQLSEARAFTPFAASAHSHVRLSFPYPVGGALLSQTWLAGGVARVQRLFPAHPSTFLELMLITESRPPVPGGLPPLTCSTGSGLLFDTLGAALLYAHLQHTFGKEIEAWESALTWRADRIWLLDPGAAEPVTFWRVHAPGMAASPLGPLLQGRREPPVLDGEDLLFWQGVPPERVEAIKAGLVCVPSP